MAEYQINENDCFNRSKASCNYLNSIIPVVKDKDSIEYFKVFFFFVKKKKLIKIIKKKKKKKCQYLMLFLREKVNNITNVIKWLQTNKPIAHMVFNKLVELKASLSIKCADM